MTKPIKKLTTVEDQLMQILWRLKKGYIKDIIKEIPSPKPAYNTVSTIIRILEQKGFVDHKAFGKTHEYFPLVDRKEYSNFYLKNFITAYFSGSFENMLSFFAKENDLNIQELEELLGHIKKDIKEGGSRNE